MSIYLTRNTATVPLKYESVLGELRYDPFHSYEIDELVVEGYRCTAPVTGVAPPNQNYWVPVIEYPVVVNLVLDGSSEPDTITAQSVEPVYVWGNTVYSQIILELVNDRTDIVWELSIDDLNFSESVSVPNLPGHSQIYVRATAVNDGTIRTGEYESPTLTLSYVDGV